MGAHGIVLLSGGLDSATALALCLERGDALDPIVVEDRDGIAVVMPVRL